MSTTITCDHCGAAIDRTDSRVTIEVVDNTGSTRLREMLRSGQKPPDLHLHLDLHQECYVEHYLPALHP